MSISSIIKPTCAACGKVAIEKSKFSIGKSVIITLECGHIQSFSKDSFTEDVYESITFKDGAKLRTYQIEAVKFAEQNNYNIIIADEQGLGKTIELLSLVKLHPEKLLPLIYVCPKKIKLQVMWEIDRICGSGSEWLVQVIQSKKEKALPGFKFYIVTYDMLKDDDLFSWVSDDIQTLVIDECQRIKNHLSERAKACQKFAALTKYHIPMSGTPIKNHSGEFFTVLNMVAPNVFNNYEKFLREDCDSVQDGWGYRVGGLRDAEDFAAKTKNLIIRRTKDEVLKDLPLKQRNFHHVELDPKFNKGYANLLKELDDLYYSDDKQFDINANRLAIMNKLRHITGISKVDDCIEFVVNFLLSTNRKIVIFTHHTDVADMLKARLNKWLKDGDFSPVLHFHSGLDDMSAHNMEKEFKDSGSRIMIASTLSAGEGLNLQFCSDAIMLERQWNPPNEVQAEDRFHRFGQVNPVTITYMIASGTIDDYFTEIVERKRAIIAATLDNKQVAWEENSLMKELTELLVTRDRKRWVF